MRASDSDRERAVARLSVSRATVAAFMLDQVDADGHLRALPVITAR